MKKTLKNIIVLSFISSLLIISGFGCHTAHGFGKDVENLGEDIQQGTK